jgi:hypothetical protein
MFAAQSADAASPAAAAAVSAVDALAADDAADAAPGVLLAGVAGLATAASRTAGSASSAATAAAGGQQEQQQLQQADHEDAGSDAGQQQVVQPTATQEQQSQQQQRQLLLVATKLTGDVNVPAGGVTFAVDLGSRSTAGAGSRLVLPPGTDSDVQLNRAGMRQLRIKVSQHCQWAVAVVLWRWADRPAPANKAVIGGRIVAAIHIYQCLSCTRNAVRLPADCPATCVA